jgi:hypothetical protein
VTQPRPSQAVAWGGSGIHRLHLPGIRVLYEIDEGASTVYIINVAQVPGSGEGHPGAMGCEARAGFVR